MVEDVDISGLVAAFGPARVRACAPLAPLTTFRVGGTADWLVEVSTSDELLQALVLGRQAGLGVTILGGGSNVLVADRGVRGLVIRTMGGVITPEGTSGVRADAGVTLNRLVRWTIGRGYAGIEAWAGTPGTVGGAVFGNAHYGGRSIGELVASARVVSRAGRVADIGRHELHFAYDHSRLRETGEVLLSAVFGLADGADPASLRARARQSLAHRKSTQPLGVPSAGCVFQNPVRGRDHVPPDVPYSAGALLDRAGLKGYAIGGALVSPAHANFIVNAGGATAADIRALIRLCHIRVQERFGVDLREEIRYLGDFDADTATGTAGAQDSGQGTGP